MRKDVPCLGLAILFWLNLSGERSAAVEVESATGDEIALRVAEPLAIGQKVGVYRELTERRGVVRHCEHHRGSFLIFVHFLRWELRREERVAACGPVRICWAHRSLGQRDMTVTATNISERGVQVEIPEAIEIGRIVRLVGESWECLGWVRYCKGLGRHFLAGIEWSTRPSNVGSVSGGPIPLRTA